MKSSKSVKARWERMMMGYSPLPYFVAKYLLIVEIITKGCRFDFEKVYLWKNVILNLPGMINYDPTLPYVYKAGENGSIAADIYIFISMMVVQQPTILRNCGRCVEGLTIL